MARPVLTKTTLEGSLMHPSEFLAAVEFKGRDVTLTIRAVEIQELQMENGGKSPKPVMSFVERPKKLVLNKTNASTIAQLYGTEASAWAGKKITMYPTKAKFGKKTVDAIRVREHVPGGVPTPPPVEQHDPDEPPPDLVLGQGPSLL